MGVLAQFPAKAISQPEVSPTLAREITTQDLQNMGEDLMGILTLLYENTSFAIVSGVNYLGGNNYSNGVIILNGIPYYFPGGVLLNKYLIPDDDSVELSITGVYNDDNTYPIYRCYSVKINNTAISGSSPQFIDNMSEYKSNLNQLKKAFKSTTENNIVLTIFNNTPVTGAQSDSSIVDGAITGIGGFTMTYNYIIGNQNIVMFNLTMNNSAWVLNINDKTGTLIETYSGSGSVNVQLFLINLGSGWVKITGFKSNIDTINSEIVSIGSQISALSSAISNETSRAEGVESGLNTSINNINDSLLTKGTPVASINQLGVDFILTGLYYNPSANGNYVTLYFPSRVPSTAKFVLFRVFMYTPTINSTLNLHDYNDSQSYADAVVTGAGSSSIVNSTADVWVPYNSDGFKYKTSNIVSTDELYLTIAGWM